MDRRSVQRLFTGVFLQSHDRPPRRIVLDLDATDDPIHGHQSGRFFHGYYMNYCYLPLYIFCGEHLLCARLRPSNIDASKGVMVGGQRRWKPEDVKSFVENLTWEQGTELR